MKTIDSDPWGLPYKIVLDKLRRTSSCIAEMISLNKLNTMIDKLFPSDNLWDTMIEEFPSPPYLCREEDKITPMEVHYVMRKRTVANTAPGDDGIKALFLKRSPDAAVTRIAECLNICLDKGCFPRDWKKATPMLIPKGK